MRGAGDRGTASGLRRRTPGSGRRGGKRCACRGRRRRLCQPGRAAALRGGRGGGGGAGEFGPPEGRGAASGQRSPSALRAVCAAPGAAGEAVAPRVLRPEPAAAAPGWAASPVPAPRSCKLAAMCRGPKLGIGFPAPSVSGGPRVERGATAGYQKRGGWVGGWEAEVCGEQNRGACLGISGGSRVWQTHLREQCLPHGRKAPAALSETKRYLSSQFPSHVR